MSGLTKLTNDYIKYVKCQQFYSLLKKAIDTDISNYQKCTK